MYKIVYTINLFPKTGEHFQKVYSKKTGKVKKKIHMLADINLADDLANTEEIDMFDSHTINDFIDFKWNEVGQSHHMFGFFIHVLYLVGLIMYTKHIYIENQSPRLLPSWGV